MADCNEDLHLNKTCAQEAVARLGNRVSSLETEVLHGKAALAAMRATEDCLRSELQVAKENCEDGQRLRAEARTARVKEAEVVAECHSLKIALHVSFALVDLQHMRAD